MFNFQIWNQLFLTAFFGYLKFKCQHLNQIVKIELNIAEFFPVPVFKNWSRGCTVHSDTRDNQSGIVTTHKQKMEKIRKKQKTLLKDKTSSMTHEQSGNLGMYTSFFQ